MAAMVGQLEKREEIINNTGIRSYNKIRNNYEKL